MTLGFNWSFFWFCTLVHGEKCWSCSFMLQNDCSPSFVTSNHCNYSSTHHVSFYFRIYLFCCDHPLDPATSFSYSLLNSMDWQHSTVQWFICITIQIHLIDIIFVYVAVFLNIRSALEVRMYYYIFASITFKPNQNDIPFNQVWVWNVYTFFFLIKIKCTWKRLPRH